MVYSPPMYRSLSDQYIRNGERERELIQNLLEVLLSSDLLPREDSLRLGGVQSVEGLAAGLGGIQGGLSGLLSGYERFSVSGSSSSERIRQHNLIVALENSRVRSDMLYEVIHPRLTENGLPPRDFERPTRLSEIRAADCGILDRILQAYNLPANNLGSLSIPHLRRPGCLLSGLPLGLSLLDRDRLGRGLSGGLNGGLGGGILSLGLYERDRLSSLGGLGGIGSDRERLALRNQKVAILLEYLGVTVYDEVGRNELGGLGGGLGGLGGQGLGGSRGLLGARGLS